VTGRNGSVIGDSGVDCSAACLGGLDCSGSVAVDVEGSGGRSKEKSPVKCVTAVRSRRRLVQQLHAVAIAASGLTARLPNLAPHNKSSLYTHNINLFAGKHFLQNAIEKNQSSKHVAWPENPFPSK